MKPSRYKVKKRRDAAEEVCFTLLIMMGLGGLDIPKEWREFLAPPMQAWADVAAETGVIPE